MDGLRLLSKERGKERSEKIEKRLKRRRWWRGGRGGGGARLAVVSSPQLGWLRKMVWLAGVGLPQGLLASGVVRPISFLCLTFQSRFLSQVV